MSNKPKVGKRKKSKKKDNKVPDNAGEDKYFERHSYKAPDTKPSNRNYRGKI